MLGSLSLRTHAQYDFCEHVFEVTKIKNGMSGQHRSIIAVCWSLESARWED